MSHLCPRCGEGEMQPKDDAWALCDRCGFTCCLDDLQEMLDRREEVSEIEEVFLEESRRGYTPPTSKSGSDLLKPRIHLEAPAGILCENCGEAELVEHAGCFFTCPGCGRGYTSDQLTRTAYRHPRAEMNRQIHECLAEDRRRGSRNGGGDPGPKKEDKLGSRSLNQVVWSDDAVKVVGQSKIESKDTWLSVRGIPEGVSGEQVRKAIERKLGL